MSNMITITSDWGDKDFYAAIFKASILSLTPNCQIVDITHKIPLADFSKAAYQIKTAFPFFPEKTIHVIAVNSINNIDLPIYQTWLKSKEKTDEKDFFFTDYIAFEYNKHFFLCQNNGCLSSICSDLDQIEHIVQLPRTEKKKHLTFSVLDYYPEAVYKLLQTKDVSQIGTPYDKKKILICPNTDAIILRQTENIIKCRIKHIDYYGNVITNLKKETFMQVAKGRRKFTFYDTISKEEYKVYLSKTYEDIRSRQNDLFFVFGESQYLEFGFYQTSWKEMMANYTKNLSNIEFTIKFSDE